MEMCFVVVAAAVIEFMFMKLGDEFQKHACGAPEGAQSVVFIWLRSWSRDPGVKSSIGLPVQPGACFSLSLPLCLQVRVSGDEERVLGLHKATLL